MLRFHYPNLDSTNLQARRLQKLNARRSILVRADEQHGGRGRYGRSWLSPRGGAWWTLTVPLEPGAAPVGVVPILAGLAAAQVIECMVAEKSGCSVRAGVEIKWPNDLLINGCKVAGILCERWPMPSVSDRDVLAIGVGINVWFDAKLLKTLDQRAMAGKPPASTILAQTGVRLDVGELIERTAHGLIRQLHSLSQGPLEPATAEAVNHRLAWRRRQVVLERGDRRICGRLMGIADGGELELQLADGSIFRSESGELSLPPAALPCQEPHAHPVAEAADGPSTGRCAG